MKYLYRVLFSICGALLFLPLSTFAGTLTNTSVVGNSYLTSANTTYTVSYTTASSVPAGWPSYVLMLAFNLNSFISYNFNGVGNGDVSVTVNGVTKTVWGVFPSNNVLHIIINESVPAGANVVVVIQDVVNPSIAGSYDYFQFKTSNDGFDTIDSGSPTPVTIVAPDTTPPVQSAIAVIPTQTSATITFTTNEAATSSFSYGPTDSYGTTTTISGSTATSHSGNISGLSNCGAVYHYQISTTDAANNTSTSTDATFVTHCGSTSGGGGYSAPLPENTTLPEEASAPTIELNSATETGTTSSVEVEKVVLEEKTPDTPPAPAVPPEEKIVVHSAITTKPYITSYIKLGKNNNKDEVKRLQVFLNALEGEHLIVDGIYKKVDVEAIKRFQKKYSQAILSYWGISKPTGYVYITTTEMINRLARENLQK